MICNRIIEKGVPGRMAAGELEKCPHRYASSRYWQCAWLTNSRHGPWSSVAWSITESFHTRTVVLAEDLPLTMRRVGTSVSAVHATSFDEICSSTPLAHDS